MFNFCQILSINSLRKFMEIIEENLYVVLGLKDWYAY